MKKNFLLTCVLLGQSFLAMAQNMDIYTIKGLDPKWSLEGTLQADTRNTNLPDKDTQRGQGRVRIGFTIDAGGVVEIVGIAATGVSFNNNWETFTTNNGQTDNAAIVFRNLYLRKVFGPTQVEAGALTPEATVGDAGLAPTGWVDGVRVITKTKLGNIKVVAGSLGDFKQPNLFKRNFHGNFIEIELERKVFDRLITKTAAQYYNDELYLQEQMSLDVTVLGNKVFKLFANALYDVERSKTTWEVGAEFDLLKNLVGKFEKRLEMKIYYSDVSEDIPLRSDMISAFHTFGPRATVQVGGKINKSGSFTWSARAGWGKTDRYDVILTYKMPFKLRHP